MDSKTRCRADVPPPTQIHELPGKVRFAVNARQQVAAHDAPLNDALPRGTYYPGLARFAPWRLGVSLVWPWQPATHPNQAPYATPFDIASARICDVLGRMIRGSTCLPSSSVLRTSLPEMNTGFSSLWFSIKSTRPAES